MTDMTLTQILFKLASFLPPDDAVAVVAQVERLMPADVSAKIVADMNTGADLTLAAHSYINPQQPLFSVSPSPVSGKSANAARGKSPKAASACLHEFMVSPDSTLGSKLDLLQQMYPARAAALYLRVLLNIVANLFEQKSLHTLNDGLLNLLIDGLLRSEAILDARCVNCTTVASSH